MTYMFILKCALKFVEEIILYYDARSKKHQIGSFVTHITFFLQQVRFHFVIMLGNDNIGSWTGHALTSM